MRLLVITCVVALAANPTPLSIDYVLDDYLARLSAAATRGE